MQQFQSYYPTQIPSYQSNYQQPMMNMSNPYMDRLTQLQQYQQSLNTFSALGKIVESEDIVKTTDIPMDGNMYYFPKADGTEVYGKKWLPNGQTQILTFKPILDVKPSNSTSEDIKLDLGVLDEFKMAFGEWMEGVNDRLDKIECSCRQNSTQKAKKVVTENAE